jgi:hypothetical protein
MVGRPHKRLVRTPRKKTRDRVKSLILILKYLSKVSIKSKVTTKVSRIHISPSPIPKLPITITMVPNLGESVVVPVSQHTMSRSRPSHWNRMSALATIMAFMLALSSNVVVSQEETSASYASSTWSPKDAFNIAYTRYPAYPPYCSIPEEMAKRDIPPVGDDVRLGESRLVHVTAVFRHGARTPYKGDLNCWDGYLESEETGVWNCDLKTITSPPTPKVVSEDEGKGNQGGDAMFLFEKRYDALQDSKDNLSNSLNGTCQVRYDMYCIGLCYYMLYCAM